ncbi:MAG: hypothetical protein ACKO6N_08895 [Myxococcota bacterium]
MAELLAELTSEGMTELRVMVWLGHGLGLILLGGGMLYFLGLYAYVRARRPEALEGLDHALSVVGMGMSVGLTLLIASGLLGRYLLHGGFVWTWETPGDQLSTLKALLFLGAWVHWGWLEVVIMHPFRGALHAGPEALSQLESARARALRALSWQALIFLVLLSLGAIRGALLLHS